MRIATWNVNGLRARLDRVLDWIDAQRPDVVCMQETKCPDEAFPYLPFEERGLHVAAHGVTAWNGVAIASRAPIDGVVAALPGDDDDELAPELAGRLVRATTAGMRVACAYAPNGRSPDSPSYEAKLRWFDRLIGAVDEETRSSTEPVFVAGDLNVAPEDRDLWDPAMFRNSTHVTPAERAAFQALVGLGLRDVVREAHPDAEIGPFSWWDYRAGAFHKKEGMRIDHVLMAGPLADRVREAGIDREARKGKKPSDHAPVVVDLAD